MSLKGREEPLSFNYFPNSRVKSHLINSDILISKEALCKMNCLNVDTMLLDHYILDGKVDFKKSEIRGYDVKTYYLFYEIIYTELNTLDLDGQYYADWTADALFIIFYGNKNQKEQVDSEALNFCHNSPPNHYYHRGQVARTLIARTQLSL